MLRFVHDGGLGGIGALDEFPPRVGESSTGRAGGGGGAMGPLQTFSPEGNLPLIAPSNVSPQFAAAQYLSVR